MPVICDFIKEYFFFDFPTLGNPPTIHNTMPIIYGQTNLLKFRRIIASSLSTEASKTTAATTSPAQEGISTNVLIVGAGPAGLSTAIRLKQLSPSLSVMVLEKAPEVGEHIISGAVFEPRALGELFPAWEGMPKRDGPPVHTLVTKDEMYWLTARGQVRIPLLPVMRNAGKNYVISLADLVKWLGGGPPNWGSRYTRGLPARGC